MFLEQLSLYQFRNYCQLRQDFSSQVNIIIGPNAQGKTNLIEAIYYLAVFKTYRPAQDTQLIQTNKQAFAVSGSVQSKTGPCRIEVVYRSADGRPKEIKINGLKSQKISELFGNLTVVMFAPEDLSIIKGTPADRRKLLDNDISQACPSYYSKLQRYGRILIQRNHLLKKLSAQGKTTPELTVWNEQLLAASEEIIRKRIEVLEKLGPLTRLMQRRMTEGKENLEIMYLLNRKKEIRKDDDIRGLLEEDIKERQAEEILRGMTLWGPHRDDLLFTLNGHDLKYYGSQGQHRTAVLSVKLAELEFFKAETGEYPVLLLDDVMSELDQARREQLVGAIQEKDIQCFITTTEDILVPWSEKTTVRKFYVANGHLTA